MYEGKIDQAEFCDERAAGVEQRDLSADFFPVCIPDSAADGNGKSSFSYLSDRLLLDVRAAGDPDIRHPGLREGAG